MYIVAYPDTLITFERTGDARLRAFTLNETKHLKIYEIREVEHIFPSGPKKPPRNPGPPGRPVEVKAA